jgi:AcrR family transcriptional regulator
MKHKSPSVSARPDARFARTRLRLGSALVYLLERRRYDRIRVSDIARVADVGRATFYRHYRTRDELLAAQFEAVLRATSRVSTHQGAPVDFTRFFAHVRDAPFIWRSLMSGGARHDAEPVLRGTLERFIGPRAPGSADEWRSVLPAFAAATLLTVLSWWIEHGHELAPARLQEIYAGLIGSAWAHCT